MSKDKNAFQRFLDMVYGSIRDMTDTRNGSYGDVLMAKADALGDAPEHTLAYYDNLQEDPTANLSERERNQIDKWMKESENLLSNDFVILTNQDRQDIAHWMSVSEHLPLEISKSRGIMESLLDYWDLMWGRKYLKNLESLEARERAAKAAKQNKQSQIRRKEKYNINDTAVRSDDKVLIRLTLRGRNSVSTVEINEVVSVAILGVQTGGGVTAPHFDTERFATLLVSDPDSALRMQAEFADATADYLAANQATPVDALAAAVVNWVMETRPGGHVYTRTDSSDGYVISEDAINLAGPASVGQERFWRVTAVGTWG